MKFIWEPVDIAPARKLTIEGITYGIAFHSVSREFSLINVETLELRYDKPLTRTYLAKVLNELVAIPEKI